MKFRRINDTHCGGKAQTHDTDEVMTAAMSSPFPVWYGGDISDIKNVKNKLVQLFIDFIFALFKVYRPDIDIWNEGNHEVSRGPVSGVRYVIKYGGCWSHGDDFFWGPIKAAAFRAKKAGAGFLKRFFIIGPIDDFREFAPNVKLNDSSMKFIDDVIGKHPEVTYFCVGHKHQKAVLEYKGRKVYVWPQGIEDIEIPEAK